MSAPVVAAWVWADEDGQSFCRMQWSVAEAESDDRPALAVPDALWGDAEFIASCRHRIASNRRLSIWECIHAELRARAGGAG
jgi:hypothetical protein